jgi:stearoyl-CoA desaturase (delta-9 desaturase)
MMAVTLYYHRDQAHRAVDLHPIVRHICRFWLWLNTGSSTREWVAVHRRHHAHCEREGDPHSPRLYGLKKVLLEGAELYRIAAHDKDTIEKYAKGTPNDWLENNLYAHPKRSYWGPWLLLIIDIVMFGVPGIIMLALQLGNMPFTAAGVTRRATATSRRTMRRRTCGRSAYSWPGRSCTTTIMRSRRRRSSRCAGTRWTWVGCTSKCWPRWG